MLANELKNKLQEVFHRYQSVTLAVIFGSIATGTHTADSDLDIAVKARYPGLNDEEKKNLIGDLAAACARPIDLVDIDTAGYPIVQQALRGVLIVGTQTEYAQELCRSLVEQEDFGYLHERVLKERREAWINK